MKIALLADAFPPMRSAGAIQLRDLARELASQGHEVVAIIASPDINGPFSCEKVDGFEILRLKARPTRDVGMVRRALGEMLMSFDLLVNLAKSPHRKARWDGIVWYSPTVFLGYAAAALKRRSRCRTYLILRDIFPDWAVDLGLMKRGLVYRLFKLVEHYQYRVADCVGVQSKNGLAYLRNWATKSDRQLEVLDNWLAPTAGMPCSIDLSQSCVAGRRILVYAGNMGVAQDLDRLINLASWTHARSDIGFVFVGRGTHAKMLERKAQDLGLTNICFYDEIPSEEIEGLYSQCHVGLVALDERHTTHNIPGKFLSYMAAGLPVMAAINPGNDLETLILNHKVGSVVTSSDKGSLETCLDQVLALIKDDSLLSARCRYLAAHLFSPQTAADKIILGLKVSSKSGLNYCR